MLSYCLKCRKNTQSINPVNSRTKNVKIMLLSRCNAKNSKFIKDLKTCKKQKGLLSNLGTRTP